MHSFDSWGLDLRLGVRMLTKHPGLTLAGGAGIAVAVAIAAGAFSVIHRNMLHSSLHLEEGERIVAMEVWDLAAGKPESRGLYEFHRWREQLRTIEDISAFRTITPNLVLPGAAPESVHVAAMTASGFRVARVRPLIGRSFSEADERDSAPPVVLIGEDIWKSRFGADPAILDRSIQLGATRHSIIGVMPSGYAFPLNHRFWVPLRSGSPPAGPRMGPEVRLFARLADGATLEEAQAEIAAAGQRTASEFPQLYGNVQTRVLRYALPFFGIHGTGDVAGLFVTQGLIASLFTLVCLNVAILVYVRTAMRQNEIGLRTALGASRGRIVMQLFLEALVLSAVAALVGIAVAKIALRELAGATAHIASELPFWIEFDLAPQAVVYALILSVLGAAIVGVVPALQATGSRLQTGTRFDASGSQRLGKIWTVLIVAQVTFAVAFLPPSVSGAWQNTRDGLAGPGFAAAQYLSAEVEGKQIELMRRLEADSGVRAVTFAMTNPGEERGSRVETGPAARPEAQFVSVRWNRVAVNYFRTLEVTILAGRDFEQRDVPTKDGQAVGGPVLVNLPFAQRVFGGNALGQRIRYNAAPEWYEIIGVVADFPAGVSPNMRDSDLKVYHAAAPGQFQPAALAIRTRAETAADFSQRLREIAFQVDPELHLRNVRSLDEALRSEQWISRLQAGVLSAATLSVLMLSSVGIYSLMAFTVSQRRREIGIRVALGAGRGRILASIFSKAAMQLAMGAALGIALGTVLESLSGGELMRGNGPIVLPAVTLGVVLVGIAAAFGPARRSLRIQPSDALRDQ